MACVYIILYPKSSSPRSAKSPVPMAIGIEVAIFSLRLPALTIIEAEMFCKNSSMQGVVKKTNNIHLLKVTDFAELRD